jgi:Cro/C1-type HTH DNA-binding domain
MGTHAPIAAKTATGCQAESLPYRKRTEWRRLRYIASVAKKPEREPKAKTAAGDGARVLLYVNEHIVNRGISDTSLANLMGIDRATVWKWRTSPERLDTMQLARLAKALGLKSHVEFYFPPGSASLDAMVIDIPADVRDYLTNMVASAAALAKQRGS